jgi:hypothetical protein
VDLGALLIAPRDGLQLRLEVEEATQRVVAVTMDLEGSSLQLQAFAAPRSEGLWDEIREQLGQSVGGQGGQVEEIPGDYGVELVAKLPAGAPDGSQGYRAARFVGVDGPRWFLRGVFGGEAALDREAAAGLEDLFRKIVVVRGENPMPPRDLLQLRLPKDAARDPWPPQRRTSSSPSAGRRSPRLVDAGGPQDQAVPIRGLPGRGRVLCHGFIESVTYAPPSQVAAFTAIVSDHDTPVTERRRGRLRVIWLGRRRIPAESTPGRSSGSTAC